MADIAHVTRELPEREQEGEMGPLEFLVKLWKALCSVVKRSKRGLVIQLKLPAGAEG
jgi:hypothetical protein